MGASKEQGRPCCSGPACDTMYPMQLLTLNWKCRDGEMVPVRLFVKVNGLFKEGKDGDMMMSLTKLSREQAKGMAKSLMAYAERYDEVRADCAGVRDE